MKKATCLLLCVLLVALCAACGDGSLARPSEGIKTIKIGVSVYNQYDTFIGVMMEKFYKYAREREAAYDITFTIVQESAGGNQLDQNSQVEDFIKDGCDIICVNLVDRTDASVIIDAAEAADVPVIFFNRELVEEDLERWDKLYYVGAEAEQSGMLQAELLIQMCQDDFAAVDKSGDGVLQYVMLEGEAGHQDAIVRTESSVNTVANAGYQLERLEDEIANWNKAQADTKMTQWIATHGDAIEVVFCNNDEMALGAIDALQRAGADPWPVVLGIDGTPAGLAAVQAGTMAGTVLNDAGGQARGMLELAYTVVTGAPLPSDITLQNGKYIRLPYKLITPENVREFIAATA